MGTPKKGTPNFKKPPYRDVNGGLGLEAELPMKRTVGKIGTFLALTHALKSLRVSQRPVLPSASSTNTRVVSSP